MKSKEIRDYEAVVKAALESAGRYSPALDIQILALASALRSMAAANRDIDQLESTTVQGTRGVCAHPAFRIRKEAEDSIAKSLKSLGLTADALGAAVEEDPLSELTEGLIEAGKGKNRVKPRKQTSKK